jgi:hypothetical protein
MVTGEGYGRVAAGCGSRSLPPLSYGSESYSVFYKNAKSLHSYKCGHRNILIFPLSVDPIPFHKVLCLFIASYTSCSHEGDPPTPPYLLDVR